MIFDFIEDILHPFPQVYNQATLISQKHNQQIKLYTSLNLLKGNNLKSYMIYMIYSVINIYSKPWL